MAFAKRIRLPGLSAMLISRPLDNIIYNREIGMDSFSRLRLSSPVVLAHAGMIVLLGLSIAAYFVGETQRGGQTGWGLVHIYATASVIALCVGAWPVAYMRSYRSLFRERQKGQLEQIYLTRLPYFEYFDGKFFGLIAPFIEMKRYIILMAVISVVSHLLATRDPFFTLLVAPWFLLAIDQFAIGGSLGTTGGIRAATGSRGMFLPMVAQISLNPWLTHIECILRSSYQVLFWGIIGGVMCSFYLDAAKVFMVVFLGAILTAWLAGSSLIAQRTSDARSEVMKEFKRIGDFVSAP